MTDLEIMTVWYLAVLALGFVAVAVQSRRARSEEVSPGCDVCGSLESVRLYANVDGVWHCASCWMAPGRPWPTRLADIHERHDAEVRTRERMTARDELDRHLVRNGRT